MSQKNRDHRPLTSVPVDEKLPEFGVLVFESHHAADFFMSFRSHGFAKIIYVLSGSGTVQTHTVSKAFQPGDVLVVPANTRHRIVDDDDAPSSLYVACIKLSLLSFDPVIASKLILSTINNARLTPRIASVMRRMVYRQQSTGQSISLSMVSDALRLVEGVCEVGRVRKSRATSTSSPDLETMRGYVAYLTDHFYEATTIDAAAEGLGMSRRQFTKLFAEVTEMTWLTFVRTHAIDYAKKRLQETDAPIASVAFECGFNDLTTFYRQFKTHAGVSPAKFRKSI